MRKLSIAITLLLSFLALVLVQVDHNRLMESHLEAFTRESRTELQAVADSIAMDFDAIYSDIRTIARLPGVRTLEAHAALGMMTHQGGVDEHTKLTIQEIYNRLALHVAVSELYIVPLEIDADSVDPNIPKHPWVTFDEFIIGRSADVESIDEKAETLEEIEIFEYRLMKEQLAWFHENVPNESDIHDLEYPALFGSEVVTCDNSRYSPSEPDDADRSGLVLSVPLYASNGEINGCVSAVILTHAVREMLPDDSFSIESAKNNLYIKHIRTILGHINEGPNEVFSYSSTIPLQVNDGRAEWNLWHGLLPSAYLSRSDVRATVTSRNSQVLAIIAVMVGAIFSISIAWRSRQRLICMNQALEGRVEERTSELKNAMLAAESAGRAKGEFLANMSHEIRTPMTAILGFAEALALDLKNPENIEAITTVKRNAEYLLEIIDDILDVSKIEAGKMTVEKVAMHPCHLIAEVISLVRVRAESKNLTFQVEYEGDIPEQIHSDPTRLRQVLINIIGNAIKFTDHGCIRLDTSLQNADDVPVLQFDITDTGPGMTQDQVAALFRPFTQADSSTTRKYGGTGLGLTISKQLTELLGGGISVVESEIGVGTKFRITIATGSLTNVNMIADPKHATVVRHVCKEKIPQASLSGYRIMLAEDGPDNQRLISYFLKKSGAQVTVVENGKLAMEAALAQQSNTTPFDCILMDMQMPIMDGYQATTRLRKANYRGLIISLTANAMSGDREKCIDAGCDDFATKPIDRVQLINTIDRWIQLRRNAA